MDNLSFYIAVIAVFAVLLIWATTSNVSHQNRIVEQQNAIMSMNDMLTEAAGNDVDADAEDLENSDGDGNVLEPFRHRRSHSGNNVDDDLSTGGRRRRRWRRRWPLRRYRNYPYRRYWSRPTVTYWPGYYNNNYYNTCRNYATRQCANSWWPQYCIPGAYRDCKLALTGTA